MDYDSEAQASEQLDDKVADVADEVSGSGQEVGKGSSHHNGHLSIDMYVIYFAPEVLRRYPIITRKGGFFK